MPQWFSSVLPLPGAPYPATDRPRRAAASRKPSRSLLIFSTAAGEALVARDRVQARGLLGGEHRLHPLGRLAGRLVGPGVDAQRAAVRGEFLDVDHPQPGRRQRTEEVSRDR